MRGLRRSSRATVITVVLALAGSGCNQDIPTFTDLSPNTPASGDAGAANWRMIVLSGPGDFPVPAPAPATSDAYRAELAAIKAAQGTLTDAQRASIEYWSGGGVLRWNEIMRELVAKADLPPAPRNGTYPAPDPENPFADPNFPFGNPPYAARAYSYVSLAQYEALKVAWFYKYQYNRPSPSKVDSGVQALMPDDGPPRLSVRGRRPLRRVRRAPQDPLPDFHGGDHAPGGGAAGGGAALRKGRGQRHRGRSRPGQGDCARVRGARRRRTGSGRRAARRRPRRPSPTPPPPAARSRGTAWRRRPGRPCSPLSARCSAWMMTPTDIARERPGPPPSTSSAQMQQELAEVKNAVDNISREQLAIVYKWADGVSTPTPPGHWNAIASEYVAGAHFSEVRAARAFALLNMAMHDAAVGCWDVKFTYFNPRPSQLDPASGP